VLDTFQVRMSHYTCCESLLTELSVRTLSTRCLFRCGLVEAVAVRTTPCSCDPQRDGNPAALFLAAAEAAIERRHVAAAARAARASPPLVLPDGVAPGRHVGTHAARGPPPRALSDAEFADFLEVGSSLTALRGLVLVRTS